MAAIGRARITLGKGSRQGSLTIIRHSKHIAATSIRQVWWLQLEQGSWPQVYTLASHLAGHHLSTVWIHDGDWGCLQVKQVPIEEGGKS